MKKIVILDGHTTNPGDLNWDNISQLGNVTIYERTEPHQIVERCAEAECVLTNKVVITAEVIRSLPQLCYIGVLATGYNVVDLAEARRRGIIVTNIPAYSTDSVVQITFAHIFNITNRVEVYAEANRKGRWSANPDFCYWQTPVHELAGKTIGIIGLGNIGMKVAQLARLFGMEVYVYTSRHASDLPEGIQKTTFDGLLSTSDIISLHCPLKESTEGIINADALKKMKQGAILINTARGALVNEADIAAALHAGTLAAYGTDVMQCEPPNQDNPLFTAPNAFVTPHIGWASVESRQRLIAIAADNLKAYINGQPVNVVS